MSQAEHLAELLSAIRDVYTSRLTSAVAITLVVYDWILNFSTEYETIYQSRWTVPKALFFYIRIITPPGILLCIYQLSDLRGPLTKSLCLYGVGRAPGYRHVHLVGGSKRFVFRSQCKPPDELTVFAALLTLRLIALYRRKTSMVWFIGAFFVASYAATLGLVIDALVTYRDAMFYSDKVKVCAATTSSATFKAIFYAPAAFEFFVFTLTAYRAWLDAKVITSNSAPFLLILYRDGIASFFIMVIARAWNIWIYLTQPLSSFNLGTQIMWSVNTVLTTRVYMNLVWLAKKPMVEETSMGTRNPTQGIRMRVTMFTEVQTDDWKTQQPSHVYPGEEGREV
ncbi:hypothetical protein M408DRAFT_21605 [Serendipita vermifera MAFF 305830]|uniref:DUF6533 domain-containing protein n=1 Tax=Serendipita vermifera MAFF 305830 TaxID=933852 RepID=A0A0C3BF50_SERVB|nr:hypothetical protein M408DRAFT_21605 [Serendipita vermifera MAFF 305830]